MTKLICSIAAQNPAELAKAIERLPQTDRIALEFRLDLMPPSLVASLPTLISTRTGTSIATIRTKDQGGSSDLAAAQRHTLLSSLDVGMVDIEYVGNHQSETAPSVSRKLLSFHDFQSIPDGLLRLVFDMESSECQPNIVKVAWKCNDICENFDALEVLLGKPGERIMICMGERGLMSRVLAAKVGAFGTFCAAEEGQAVAPGQLSAGEMLTNYRWLKINASSKFFGVIGSPVGHSLSPVIFNAQFERDNCNGVYLPLLIEGEDELIRFLDGCSEKPWLDATGFSVTIPHKKAVCRWLGDRADDASRRIGAVNTLHLQDGSYHGFNTDYLGIQKALEDCAGLDAASLASVRATVLGAGGVARAAVAALVDSNSMVTICNRSAEKATSLAGDFGCKAAPWDERTSLQSDLIINCTSVGMTPHIAGSPFPVESLKPETIVFDTVYRPLETALLKGARAAGCKVIGGLEMFVHQAAAQYKIWTGIDADISQLRKTALQAIDDLKAQEARGNA